MKVAIVGSRDFVCYKTFLEGIEQFTGLLGDITHVVSGGARGADTLAKQYADENDLPLTVFFPDYKRYGRYKAPLKRNEEIIDASAFCLAFWDGESHGTKYTIGYAEKTGVPTKIIYI